MENTSIKLDKVYRSEVNQEPTEIKFDKKNIKRPSWINIKLDKKIIFIKIIYNDESFWYRRYFNDYFFPLENTSEDYKNYYDEIAGDYESYVPQNKKMGEMLIKLFKELDVDKQSKILDFGAGTGLVTEQIALEGYKNLSLIDISKNELEIAKKKEILKDANYEIIDATKEEIKGNFDVIFETMSIDYFKGDQMKNILNKINNALNNKGKFILIDRHLYPEFEEIFKKIKSGVKKLETPEGTFNYYYFVGEKK